MLSSGRNEKCSRWKYASPRRYQASASSGYRATRSCSLVIASGRQSLMAALAWSVSASRTGSRSRSEEHTSELQSQSNLVCRLLLEKKKKNTIHLVVERKRVIKPEKYIKIVTYTQHT